MSLKEDLEIEILVGKTLTDITVNSEKTEIVFATSDQKFLMYHEQDCCEGVWLEDITGDLDDLVGCPILSAEEASNTTDTPLDKDDSSYTWTFYHIRTLKGTVTLRWYGASNGYYSEHVYFKEIKP